MKDKNIIIGVTCHSVSDVEQLLASSNFSDYSFIRWNGKKTKKKIKEKVIKSSHLLFSKPSSLGYAFSKGLVTRTPFVWGSPSILNRISLSENLYCLDADISIDGIVTFRDINEQELASALNKEWTKNNTKFSILDSVVENKDTQYGIMSNLQRIINNILDTLPEFCHVPFMVAFTKGTNDKFKTFDIFVKENRLVSRQNKTSFKELDNTLYSIMNPVQMLVKHKKKKLLSAIKELNSSDYQNLKCIKKYRDSYLNYNLSDFLDNEDNINISFAS